MTAINRRRAITTTSAVAAGMAGLTACGDDAPPTATEPSVADPAEPLATTSDVPVGGCHVVSDAKVVLTQPEEGTFKAFSSVCTHQGCAVSSGTDGVIPCNCHGSRFSLADGSVVEGPANQPLPEFEITVDGESILLA